MPIRFIAMLCATAAAALLSSQTVNADGTVLPLPAKDQQELLAQLGPGVVGAALPSLPIDDATRFFPLQEREMTYQITAGKNAGTTHTLHVAKGKRPNGLPAWRMGLTPSVDGFLRQTPDGDLVMAAMSDSSEGVVIVSTPPNPFLIPGMKPGETRTVAQAVAVNYLDDPSRQDY